MSERRLEVADVFRSFMTEFLNRWEGRLSLDQKRVLRAVSICRTRELGGHRWQCDRCGHERNAYNSCRNRHCPKCQATARAAWLDARAADLLPVPYFHVVFTLPDALGPLALQNPRTVYGILFRAAWQSLRDVAADSKHLGAKIGMIAVLHTWGQNLMHHPHVHCVVPGGVLSSNEARWISCRKSRKNKKKFFLPVRVLSRVFRGKFVELLKQACRQGKLQFHGRLAPLADPARFEQLLDTAVANDWVVYCKRPFGGPRQVLKYLARYTHRVAIANSRLIGLENDRVAFRWKDYARGGRMSTMRLEACEFIRRFLLHVLPSGFVRIRHFGFLANRKRQSQIDRCRELLGVKPSENDSDPTAETPPDESSSCEPSTETGQRCPHCGACEMRIVEVLLPRRYRALSGFAAVANSRAPPINEVTLSTWKTRIIL